MAAKKKKPGLEEALQQLESLVETLEDGDLSLEESLQVFESGVKLTRECQQRLAEAEQKVQQLIEDQGQVRLTDFDSDLADTESP